MREELLNLVGNELGIDFLTDIIKGLPVAYASADYWANSQYEKSQANDIFPYLRRLNVDNLLKEVSNKYHGFIALPHKNKAKNCSHVRVETDNIIITANAVQNPTQIVRHASFRKTLAKRNQLTLPFPDIPIMPSGNAYYAVLLHGSQLLDKRKVGFAYLAFPSKSFDCYITKINLERFCNIGLYDFNNEENIQDKTFVILRDKPKAKEPIYVNRK